MPNDQITLAALARPDVVRRFLAKVVVASPDECWIWTAVRGQRGHGRFSVSSRNAATASRVMWLLRNGAIPAGLFVCHHCDNPPCCNPAHLFLGTPKDNTHDAMRKGRLDLETARRNGIAARKIPLSAYDDVRRRLALGERMATIAVATGISLSSVRNIRSGRSKGV